MLRAHQQERGTQPSLSPAASSFFQESHGGCLDLWNCCFCPAFNANRPGEIRSAGLSSSIKASLGFSWWQKKKKKKNPRLKAKGRLKKGGRQSSKSCSPASTVSRVSHREYSSRLHTLPNRRSRISLNLHIYDQSLTGR